MCGAKWGKWRGRPRKRRGEAQIQNIRDKQINNQKQRTKDKKKQKELVKIKATKD